VESIGSLHGVTRSSLLRIRVVLFTILFWAAIRFSVAAQESISLSWMPSASPQSCSYAVYYGTESGSYDCRFDAGTNTMATITNLNQGTIYYFVVVTVDSNGTESTPSNEVSYAVPNRPPAFNSIYFQNGQLVLRWNSVPGRTYQIEFKRDLTQSAWRPLGNVVTASGPTTTLADNLRSVPQRFYRVRVVPDNIPAFEDIRE
jgi:hypothetical protein